MMTKEIPYLTLISCKFGKAVMLYTHRLSIFTSGWEWICVRVYVRVYGCCGWSRACCQWVDHLATCIWNIVAWQMTKVCHDWEVRKWMKNNNKREGSWRKIDDDIMNQRWFTNSAMFSLWWNRLGCKWGANVFFFFFAHRLSVIFF